MSGGLVAVGGIIDGGAIHSGDTRVAERVSQGSIRMDAGISIRRGLWKTNRARVPAPRHSAAQCRTQCVTYQYLSSQKMRKLDVS